MTNSHLWHFRNSTWIRWKSFILSFSHLTDYLFQSLFRVWITNLEEWKGWNLFGVLVLRSGRWSTCRALFSYNYEYNIKYPVIHHSICVLLHTPNTRSWRQMYFPFGTDSEFLSFLVPIQSMGRKKRNSFRILYHWRRV